MKDPFTQRIAGRDLDIGLRSFGWSMYGDEDIDDNSYPDFAVGAYESDTVLMFRARPIVNVVVEIEMTPNPIPLTGSLLTCSTDNESLCFTVKVKFRFDYAGSRKGKVDNVYLNWTFDSDTLHKSKEGWSRVSFTSFDKQDIITENITLSGPRVYNKTYIMNVKRHRGKPEPKDPWTNVRMEGRFELIPSREDTFDDLDPILSKDVNTLIIEDTKFDKKCDISTCTSDLRLQVEMFLLRDGVVPTHVLDDTVLYVDAANMLQVTTDVLNLLNSSYRANVSGEVSALMKRDVISNTDLIGASCKYESPHQTSTIVNCTADSRLDRNENMKIKMYYDISRQCLIPGMDLNKMKEGVHISMLADQANLDVDTSNNDFKRTILVKLKYAVHIQADKEKSDQVRYKADEKSTHMLRLIHRYVVTNEGPSFLPKTYVNITIPLAKEDAEFVRIVELPSECVYNGTIVFETSTQASSTAKATKFSLPPDTKPETRRREAEQSAQSAKSTGEKSEPTSKAMNITCNDDFSCEVIECEILNLEHNKQHIIYIKLDVFENKLAKQKEFLEIHYATYATVTDPFIWYGGKVVPWNKTVYAEKWTTFVVELTSDVSVMVIMDYYGGGSMGIIIGSVYGALAVLVIIIIILKKCGFFARKKHKEVQEWKRATLYNRKSVRLSNNETQPYSAIEETET
ncbi:integrin alpha-9-like [Ruditapes philippinarum]|uniref:integrin alpha-9-like n=1 Tax=Ruditapes philippinarum TaxID=129788 RepID=UPI00295BD690|nr:integrin alpha-9-like [Ruditapes philippinarum]